MAVQRVRGIVVTIGRSIGGLVLGKPGIRQRFRVERLRA
jgi:hypothetical protein